jgi:hypothetical protein
MILGNTSSKTAEIYTNVLEVGKRHNTNSKEKNARITAPIRKQGFRAS